MAYEQFGLLKAKQSLGLTTVENVRFLPVLEPVAVSEFLNSYLKETLPLAAAGSKKARSELIISPVLVELRRLLDRQISVFSGEEFTVDEALGLNGICDFLISRSPELLAIEAPAVVIVEAKKADISSGIGQCIAEMVAAQKFNEAQGKPLNAVYGAVSSGTLWRFIKLEQQTATIDLTDYPLLPVEQLMAYLAWMVQAG